MSTIKEQKLKNVTFLSKKIQFPKRVPILKSTIENIGITSSIPKRSIIYLKGKGFISEAILAAQDIYWKEYGKKSNFSHVAIRLDDGYIYESTVKLNFIEKEKEIKIGNITKKVKYPVIQFVYNVYRSTLEEYLATLTSNNYEKVVIHTNFQQISDNQWEIILNKAKELYDKKYKYGGLELFGTLFTLIRWKLTKDPEKRKEILSQRNPFDDKQAVYCIAFVADLMKAANVPYTPDYIDTSVLTVDHGYYTSLKCSELVFRQEE